EEARSTVARGLALLGTACVELSQYDRGEEILRLAVQYTTDGATAADVYFRLGLALLAHRRAGEAIGPLRRAIALEDSTPQVWPAVGKACLERERSRAALGAALGARKGGVSDESADPIQHEAVKRLGPGYEVWASFLSEHDATSPSSEAGAEA